MHLNSLLFLLFSFCLNVQANNVQLDLKNVHAHAGNIEHELDLKSAHVGKVHDEVKSLPAAENEKFHEQNLERCNCKHHYKYDMTEEDVYSDDGNSIYELDVLRDDPLGEGTFGMVFHVSPVALKDMDGIEVRQCVAMKEIKRRNDPTYKKEIEILKKFATLKEEHRKHLMRLIQTGYRLEYGKKVSVYFMELGEISLHDYLRKAHLDLDAPTLKRVAKDIALAIRDLHRVAMHLDLKPANMMYVRDPTSGDLILKAIDFGTCQLIPHTKEEADKLRHDLENRANACQRVHHQLTTLHYRAPENTLSCGDQSFEKQLTKSRERAFREKMRNQAPILLSPKADIYAIGMMLLTAVVQSPTIDMETFYVLREKRLTTVEIIGELRKIYIFERDEWAHDKTAREDRHYLAHLWLLLHIRKVDPDYFNLTTATLYSNPHERLSTVGILVFLENNCKPAKSKSPTGPKLIIDAKVKEELKALWELKFKSRLEKLEKSLANLKASLVNLELNYAMLISIKKSEMITANFQKLRNDLDNKIKTAENAILKIEEIENLLPKDGQTIDLRQVVVDEKHAHLPECDTKTSEIPKFNELNNVHSGRKLFDQAQIVV